MSRRALAVGTTPALACVCAWCRRVLVDGVWRAGTGREIAPAAHGLCEDCFGVLVAGRTPEALR